MQTVVNEIIGIGELVDIPRGEAALLDSKAVRKIVEEVVKGVREEMAKEFTEEVANILDNSKG